DTSGAQVSTLPTEADILPGVFSTDVGVEADPLKLPDNGYIWFEVNGITPARDRSLEEVKSQVEERWRDQQIAEKLQAKATALVDKLKAGTPLPEAAAAENAKVGTAADVRRNAANAALSNPAVAAAFTTPKGAVGTAEGRTPAERVVFRVADINVPKIDDANPEGKRIEDTLRNAIGDDLLRQYVAQVERDLGTSINNDALRRVTGGESF
ncbi:MAG TPA: peptidylprolyl isomerase, partial [Xanthobacteraceae bacterium]